MDDRVVITVDGLAGSGKTAISAKLAEELKFCHFNSGLLYRAVGFLILKEGISPDDEKALGELLSRHKIRLDMGDSMKPVLFIDGRIQDTERLHAPEVSEAASQSSKHAIVREALIDLQRDAFPGRNIVAEGRDMGTVVFPDAPLKFFIEADQKVRIQRRVAQLYASSSGEDRESIEKRIKIEILERDKRDTERTLSPTKPATDAVIVDNSALTLTQVVKTMYDLAASWGVT